MYFSPNSCSKSKSKTDSPASGAFQTDTTRTEGESTLFEAEILMYFLLIYHSSSSMRISLCHCCKIGVMGLMVFEERGSLWKPNTVRSSPQIYSFIPKIQI